MKQIEECKLCGGKNFKTLGKQEDKNFHILGEFSLEGCWNCKVIWTNPQLSTEKDFETYYSNDYYAFREIIKGSELKKARLMALLYEVYYHDWVCNPLLKYFLLPIKFLVRGTKIHPGKKLLDVGCGSGQFLYEMKQFGMDVYGIEPGKITKSNLNIKPDLIKAKYKKESFDLITMNHVLQHVDNPKEMIKDIHKILKQDGLFIVSISNLRSLAHALFKEDWFQLDIPRHLFNISDKRLIRFLEENGFKVIKNRHNSRPNQFVMSLFFKFGVKRRSGVLNRILEVTFLPLTLIVNIFKIGDQAELWCVKK